MNACPGACGHGQHGTRAPRVQQCRRTKVSRPTKASPEFARPGATLALRAVQRADPVGRIHDIGASIGVEQHGDALGAAVGG